MDTLDNNIFTDRVCPLLSGKIIDNILLVNKDYNSILKADMKHLYSLFWSVKEITTGYNEKIKKIYKDGKLEGEQLWWCEDGQLEYKEFYKDGKKEGEQLWWCEDGQLEYKEFYKDGKMDGEQLGWYSNGQLEYKEFYKDGKLDGEQLKWFEDGQLEYKEFYKDGKLEYKRS